MQIFAILIALVGAVAFEGMVLLHRRRIVPAGALIAFAPSIFLTMVGVTVVGLNPPSVVAVDQPIATEQ